MTDFGPWVSELVADRIKKLRLRRGFTTAEALAQRCVAIGAPNLTTAVLMNIESGRKGRDKRRRRAVDVDELVALAHALNVSPLSLLLPEDGTAEYHINPQVTASAEKVCRWLIGLRPLPPTRTDDPESALHPGLTAAHEAAFYAELPGYLPQLPSQAEPEELIRWLEEAADSLKALSAGTTDKEHES
jgi:transcriptional regulator with XRE-family HTH domain